MATDDLARHGCARVSRDRWMHTRARNLALGSGQTQVLAAERRAPVTRRAVSSRVHTPSGVARERAARTFVGSEHVTLRGRATFLLAACSLVSRQVSETLLDCCSIDRAALRRSKSTLLLLRPLARGRGSAVGHELGAVSHEARGATCRGRYGGSVDDCARQSRARAALSSRRRNPAYRSGVGALNWSAAASARRADLGLFAECRALCSLHPCADTSTA